MESKEEILQNFGRILLEAIESKGISIRKLALASGLEYTQVQRITKGKVNLELSTVIALCNGLEITPAELFRHWNDH
ncbi:helix-turn-helix domain-containing protein [Olivibacter domesticus]|uniref:Cro/C1-type HTH DNA-binding domain-containing protein n=1 Tax=Olivibacter domesticus TaxID=407022 RepID=A0A1H7I8P5_OLID1|nr:helix-turn-helix transcriptional regulator [Olivibacter domesticus]SEK58212.1 Cro/C1-type HTH DNA-binding domain-containing protein [Olivibacter domesticus]